MERRAWRLLHPSAKGKIKFEPDYGFASLPLLQQTPGCRTREQLLWLKLWVFDWHLQCKGTAANYVMLKLHDKGFHTLLSSQGKMVLIGADRVTTAARLKTLIWVNVKPSIDPTETIMEEIRRVVKDATVQNQQIVQCSCKSHISWTTHLKKNVYYEDLRLSSTLARQ